jgi:thiopurine S-methyltransferase
MKKPAPDDLNNYWSNRYINKSTGWELGNISRPLKDYIDQLEDKTIQILIPGAGNAYEAEYLFNQGFKNTFIIDVSEIPLNNFKIRVPEFSEDQIINDDFFNHQGHYDLILEQTFMCSFPPIENRREMYVTQMKQLLKPNGKLAGVWFKMPFSGDYEKRPFGITEEEFHALFKPHFNFKTFNPAYNSVPSRDGLEHFGILEKK